MIASPKAVAAGKHVIKYEFVSDGRKPVPAENAFYMWMIRKWLKEKFQKHNHFSILGR